MEAAAAERTIEAQATLEAQYGTLFLGIEDEFTIHRVSRFREDELAQSLQGALSEKYGGVFTRIDKEHPLIRVQDSLDDGENRALHMPGTFRLELVTNHEPIPGEDPALHAVQKAFLLRDMREMIAQIVEGEEFGGVVSHNPRPIPDVYYYLTNTSVYEQEYILSDIKAQAEEQTDLIGRDRILAARSLEELFLSENPVLQNHGAAGSGVHLNFGFKGKDGVNPFYNPDDPDIGTKVTWNAAAGVIDVTAESVLSFANVAHASWKRLGNKNLSAPTHAAYSPLKKSGAIVKQSPYTQGFYDMHGLPAKEVITPQNAHLEIRHADPGFGLRDGAAPTMLQIAASLAGMQHGLEKNQIGSYQELLAYRAPLCGNYAESYDKYCRSSLLPQVLGQRLYYSVRDYIEVNATREEAAWDPIIFEEEERSYTQSSAVHDTGLDM